MNKKDNQMKVFLLNCGLYTIFSNLAFLIEFKVNLN